MLYVDCVTKHCHCSAMHTILCNIPVLWIIGNLTLDVMTFL